MSDLLTESLNNALNSVNNAVAATTNAVNTALAQITAVNLGIATINVGFATFQTVNGPVGPGVTLDIPSNTSSVLSLLDPVHFQGTIDFYTNPSGVPKVGAPSLVGLPGIPSDSWTFANNVLTLFSGGQVTDTVKVIPDPVGFGVFRANGGTVIGSAPVPVATGLIPLPGHM
jgi:hypothetical protein